MGTRLVALGYADFVSGSPSTFYGPISYTVSNHAGRTEAQMTVALGTSTTALTG